MKPKDLILEVLDQFGVNISYFTAWKAKGQALVDKYSLAVMGLLHQRRELACEMADNELIPAVRDVIERLEKKHTSPFYHVNAFRATYGGYIFPFDNEEDWGKVKPEDVVQPPPLERHPGRPKKQRG
ncbi:hypothetical protein IFM89_017146 [Coptis chinensis]|uniref:Uncharacterized protein n=1 Tax=Coptis chinensis TaxID=261450 RepID=A0A835ICY7_9MAGN|nr:hypothetical protein IFM89_017146 [Coptis chinensis]